MLFPRVLLKSSFSDSDTEFHSRAIVMCAGIPTSPMLQNNNSLYNKKNNNTNHSIRQMSVDVFRFQFLATTSNKTAPREVRSSGWP